MRRKKNKTSPGPGVPVRCADCGRWITVAKQRLDESVAGPIYCWECTPQEPMANLWDGYLDGGARGIVH